MEAMEELMGTPKDHTHIVKGKRTKRQRPQSPIPFTIAAAATTTNSSSGGYGSSSPPPPTSAHELMDSATEEEEDMANCLILLAQGHSRRDQSTHKKPNDDDHEDAETELIFKFNSKRYIETTSSMGNGNKVGMYVYQCKTCGRTFPSFQALGGHRASHKKPKSAMISEKIKAPPLILSDDEEQQQQQQQQEAQFTDDLQLSSKGFHNMNLKFNKVHECSICGAEFSSGQALGGHMRRHRGPASAANTTLSLSPIAIVKPEESKKTRNGLSLDLNLPAPEDEHNRESKFAFDSKQQQQQQQSPLVLSAAPTLVDCHY
uniref:Putative C2H2-type zinc finger family protein n=1 Tax=Davidia involucrata TaxID=16924 RepID=A0A5B7BFF2_DAVIN